MLQGQLRVQHLAEDTPTCRLEWQEIDLIGGRPTLPPDPQPPHLYHTDLSRVVDMESIIRLNSRVSQFSCHLGTTEQGRLQETGRREFESHLGSLSFDVRIRIKQ